MIMSICLLMGLYMYVCGIFCLLFQWKHILNILLSFEVLTLGVVFIYIFSIGFAMSNFFLVVVLMVFGVCEASIGLSLLVSFIRVHGNDYVISLNVLKL
uniref:NADH-ubiquinone oxidoreductase chain 4L n=1 Tax=Tremoctopus violaceus TaxID=102883 RepID=A0A3Q8BXY3_9MOLL|nr:NADH dehydrogenase subunit 4L [Tremoctopus violaceus]ATR85797.1 NADH dehydrogenase subunit 4L [Tremoctopus violaceus]WBK26777.1 NADH dehydrogenase subunit 4L [Tremoctopus violaceus]